MENKMNTGMLWFDNDPQVDIRTKLNRAITYYQKKYGQMPDLCYVHPSMLTERPVRSSDIDVQPDQMILPNHFWIGLKSVSGVA
jgi:hypothetical protein